MKILIIDDDLRNIFALQAVLRAKGVQTVTASSVLEGLQLLDENGDISVVLLDIMMPEIDGFEAIQRIRANEKTSSLPIVAVTAKAMEGDRNKCIEAGANDYVSKPVDINKLTTVLSQYINLPKIAKC